MSQTSGLALDHFIVPEDKALVRERTLAREHGDLIPGVNEYRIRRTDGTVRTVESSAVGITFNGQPATLAVLRDITVRREAARLELLKNVALALSHQLKNAVNPILIFSNLYRPDNPESGENLQRATREQGERITAITRAIEHMAAIGNISTTSILGPGSPEMLDLDPIISQLLEESEDSGTLT